MKEKFLERKKNVLLNKKLGPFDKHEEKGSSQNPLLLAKGE